MKKIFDVIDRFKSMKILVIGDVMLDRYIIGDVTRISPEAPVQVVNVEKEDNVPGGAANVANNIASLGGSVYMIGIVGDDGSSKTLKRELQKRSIITDYLITDAKRPTIQKMRAVARGQQLLRIDFEKRDEIGNLTFDKVVETVEKLISKVNLVVVSDYDKGIISKRLMEKIIEIAGKKNKAVIVDPKPQNMDFYKGCTLMTPNHIEASKMAGIEEKNDDDLNNIGEALMAKLDCELIISRGKNGMSLFKRDGKVKHIPTKAREVYDVTGAGDTVVAALALSMSGGASLEDASVIANHAAGLVVGKVGTSTTTVKELKGSIKNE